jgi:hypothetical protein
MQVDHIKHHLARYMNETEEIKSLRLVLGKERHGTTTARKKWLVEAVKFDYPL